MPSSIWVMTAMATGVLWMWAHDLPGQPTAFAREVKSLSSVVPVIPESPDLDQVLAEDRKRDLQGGPFRFAIPRPVHATPETAGLWEDLNADTRLWRLPVASADAVSLSLGFARYVMPPTGQLFVYSADHGQVVGPFTSKHNKEHGQLWTPLIFADALIVELTIKAVDVPHLRLELTTINHGYRWRDPFSTTKAASVLGDSQPDVACPEGEPWRKQARSVARYHITQPGAGGTVWCTGTLVNNTAQDRGGYFLLTASHCFDAVFDGVLTGAECQAAASMVVYWNYQAESCGGWTAASYKTQTGAVMRAWYNPTDCVLVELEDTPPLSAEVYRAGWDRSNAIPSGGIAIHHPSGGLKKISIERDPLVVTSNVGQQSPGNGLYLRVTNWDVGATEPGSSGCALFDPNGRVVGQLSTGLVDYPGLSWFGRLYRSWTGGGTKETRLKDWLDPCDTGVFHLDGREDGTIIFEDSFASTQIDKAKWVVANGVTVDDQGLDEPSPPYSLRLNGHPSGGDIIESNDINLSQCAKACLHYAYERGGGLSSSDPPEKGDDLIIEYHDGLAWVELDRQYGNGPEMTEYKIRTVALPPKALRSAFRLRIRSVGKADPVQVADDWFVDDVIITGR